MNTIDELGDLTTFREIIKDEITEFKDDTIIDLKGYAFRYCTSLTSVSFPNATSIGEYAFDSCSKLTSVSFPNATSIGGFVFRDCSKLTTLYIGTETDTVCTLANANLPSTVAYIYVPSALVEQYKTATNWSKFADRIKAYTGETA